MGKLYDVKKFKSSLRFLIVFCCLVILNGCSGTTYKITFESNGGTFIDSKEIKSGENIVLPTPVKIGYTFEGWYQGDTINDIKVDRTDTIEGDVILYAKWNVNQYTISFESNGGSFVHSITQDYDTPIVSPPKPTKDGYDFKNWHTNSALTKAYIFSTMPAEDISLYAEWEMELNVDQYTISFDSNGGSFVDSITQDYNTSITKPTDPTKEGYLFEGWFLDIALTEAYVFSTMPSKNITLYARWGTDEVKTVLNGVEYVLNGEVAIVTSYTGNSNEVILPSSVVLDGKSVAVTQIGKSAFFDCINLKSITIPSSVTGIKAYSFDNCYQLTFYCEAPSWPEGWEQLWNTENRPVYWGINDSNFTEINGVQYLLKDGEAVISRYVGNDDKVILPSIVIIDGQTVEVTTIEKYAFTQCKTITNIIIPTSITSIGYSAFQGCKNLTSITIPSSVAIIEHYAFIDCSKLTIYCEASSQPSEWLTKWNLNRPVYWGKNSSNYLEIDHLQFVLEDGIAMLTRYTGDQSEVIIPSSIYHEDRTVPVTQIKEHAFANSSYLQNVTIPSSVTTIDEYAFYDCYRLTIYCEVSSQPSGWESKWNFDRPVYWRVDSGNFLEVDGLQYVIKYGYAKITRYTGDHSDLVLPSTVLVDNKTVTVTEIGELAFTGSSNLTSVTIPSSITKIGKEAFGGCINLTSISIPSTVTSIGDYAFSGCSSLTNITLPNAIKRIGYGTFANCRSLTNITIPSSVTFIGDYAFFDCHSLISIVIPDGITRIERYLFSNCISLTSVSLPTSVTSIGDGAFDRCTSLASITLPNNIIIIGEETFKNCTSLTTINIPKGVTTIGYYAFFNCVSLTSITLPNSITTIDSYAFLDCTGLITINIPSSVTSIRYLAFAGCSSLKSITIPSSVTNIKEEAFDRCTSLTIYCEATSQPSTWDTNWNISNRPVVWGYVSE